MDLPADVVEEILLRFPTADPASLVRAALVCKPWCPQLPPPVHGVPRRGTTARLLQQPLFARFAPTSSFRPPHAGRELSLLHDDESEVRECVAVNARHGLVLLYFVLARDDVDEDDALVVGFGERWEILIPNGTDFVVVRVVTKIYSYSLGQRWSLRVYSSAAASWSEPTLIPKCSVDLVPTALVGNAVYFSIDNGTRVLSFDLATWETSVVQLPRASECATALMEMEGGGLGFARVDMAARLSLWSMEVNPNGGMGWTRIRVIDLDKLLPVDADSITYGFLGFAHGVDVFFVGGV